jgi:hypothetical protein
MGRERASKRRFSFGGGSNEMSLSRAAALQHANSVVRIPLFPFSPCQSDPNRIRFKARRRGFLASVKLNN